MVNAGSPRRRTLAAMLKAAREGTEVSARELARQLGVAHTTVNRWESGESPVDVEDASAYLARLGVVGKERERILAVARDPADEDWLASGPPGMSLQLAGVINCERTATGIFEWSPLGIPGVMQTSDYARIVVSSDDVPRAEIETRLMARLARRDALTRREPVQFEAAIGEPAIRARVGGPVVMADQLRQVLALSDRDNITVRTVSVTGEWHPGNLGSFIIYDFEDRPSIVYHEHLRGGAFLADEHDVAAYKTLAGIIRQAAMSAEDQSALIAEAISTLETPK